MPEELKKIFITSKLLNDFLIIHSDDKRKAEITAKYGREAFADGKRCISKAKKKYRVPDTAHDCPILRIGVMHEQPVSERENLSKWELFYF